MAGYSIKLDTNADAPVCRLKFGQANAANYWLYKFLPGEPDPVLLHSGTVIGGDNPEHVLGGSAAVLDGVGITLSARFISPLINPQGPENFASVTVSFLQGGDDAGGSPRTKRMMLKNGVAAFDVGFVLSAS